MSDSHTPAVSSTGFSELRPAIRDAIADSLAEIVSIQNDEGPLTAERFEQCERRIRKACMELGRRVLQEVLEDRDAQLPDAVKRDGRVWRRRTATPKTITTLLGRVTYKRSRYRTSEAGASWVPIDDGLGLVGGHLTRPRGFRSGRSRSRSFATGSRRRSRRRSRFCVFPGSTMFECARRTCSSV